MNNKPSPQKSEKSPWMIVYITHNLTEAHIVQGRLQHDGIVSVLNYNVGMRAIGLTLGEWGEVRVLVHSADYDTATEILYPELPDELESSVDPIIYHIDDEDKNAE